MSESALAAEHTFTAPQEISSEHQLLSSYIVSDIYNENYWQKCASSATFIKWAAALCFLGDLTVFTQQSAPQCCPISCMTHWIADLWVCVCERAEYPAITGRAPQIKPAPADCVSQCKSTGTRLHYPLHSGNSHSLENPSPMPLILPLHTAHIFVLYLHYSCCLNIFVRKGSLWPFLCVYPEVCWK